MSKIHDAKKQKVCTFTYTVTVPKELEKVATYSAAKGITLKSKNGVKAGTYKFTVQAKVGTTVMTNGKYEMSFILEKTPENGQTQLTINSVANAA